MRDFKTISIDVENTRDAVLSAKLEMPADEKPHGFAIFSNCFTCEKKSNKYKNYSDFSYYILFTQ